MSFLSKGLFEERIARIGRAIDAACSRAGRDPQTVELIGVSKKHPSDSIRVAFESGLLDFGENFAQEWDLKAKELLDLGLRWHFVGGLQRKKARLVVGRTHLIHSVDRASLMEEIAKRAEQSDLTQDILLQVSIAGEESKGGVSPAMLHDLYERCLDTEGVRVRGLMIFPPFVREPEENRANFAMGKRLLDDLRADFPAGAEHLVHLSMGMSGDFEVAIEEGATLVRVGTALFGARPS